MNESITWLKYSKVELKPINYLNFELKMVSNNQYLIGRVSVYRSFTTLENNKNNYRLILN